MSRFARRHGYSLFAPYVRVADRRKNAAREVTKRKELGLETTPIVIEGRKIASTFWGKAWCENLEAYSDFANRLPRGRTYVRNGSVVHLAIEAQKVKALVSGSSLYQVAIDIKPAEPSRWREIADACAGKIDSLIELLQGKLSGGVMDVITRKNSGLFPAPHEIALDCSCPDFATMCKHVAATLYGVGARLDAAPELLFVLRGVDAADLVSAVSQRGALEIQPSNARATALEGADLGALFGIDLDERATPIAPEPERKPKRKTGPQKKAQRRGKKSSGRRAVATQDGSR